jgi:hypothetical protein
MSDTATNFNVRQRLAEAQSMLRQAAELWKQHQATDTALQELATVWNDPKAAAYRAKFEASGAEIAAFVKSSEEYLAFLEKLAAAEEARSGGRAGRTGGRKGG